MVAAVRAASEIAAATAAEAARERVNGGCTIRSSVETVNDAVACPIGRAFSSRPARGTGGEPVGIPD